MRANLAAYGDKWRHIHAELDGNDLARLGIPRGRIYRAILANLRAARLDGLAHSREDEVELALHYFAQSEGEGLG